MKPKVITMMVGLILCGVLVNQKLNAQEHASSGFEQYDSIAKPWLAKMTLAEKVGQMVQAELSEIPDHKLITELSLGSVLSGGNADPDDSNSVEAWTSAYKNCQTAALDSRLGIPILYGIDAVHGHNNVQGAVIFPHNIGLGCANDEDLVERISRATALEMRATGIHWTFAPCVTVPRDDRWGRTYEGYSEDPEICGRLGAAAVRGLQTDNLIDPTSVLGCAKHFVGDGGTIAEFRSSSFHEYDGIYWDQGDTRCDKETLRRIHLSPYLPCLQENVGTVMPSYSSWNGVKCSGSKELLTDLLKDELGFSGFLISDYDAIDQCHPDYKTAIKIAINAGMDMAMVPKKYREFISLLTELVEEGEVPMARIDDAVLRILRVKAAMGLLDEDRTIRALETLPNDFGSNERRLIAREAVRKSLVVLKSNDVLPLSSDQGRIHVSGIAADDIGIQCGGWTIDWQGGTGEIIQGGTTILDALRELSNGAEITYSKDGSEANGANVNVVVVGESPYAEGKGDSSNLGLSDHAINTFKTAKASGTPVVLILLSGRPMVLPKSILEEADAIIAAWLPGTEGTGVADVIYGHYPPSGKLSFSWPRSTEQHPINIGDENYDPLFPFGHGLTK